MRQGERKRKTKEPLPVRCWHTVKERCQTPPRTHPHIFLPSQLQLIKLFNHSNSEIQQFLVGWESPQMNTKMESGVTANILAMTASRDVSLLKCAVRFHVTANSRVSADNKRSGWKWWRCSCNLSAASFLLNQAHVQSNAHHTVSASSKPLKYTLIMHWIV